MRLPFLKHLVDSVLVLARPERIVVVGSSSLLPSHPALDESGQPLELSLDADFLINPMEQMIADLLSAFLRLGIIQPARLQQHYQQTPLGEREAMTAGRNLTKVLQKRGLD